MDGFGLFVLGIILFLTVFTAILFVTSDAPSRSERELRMKKSVVPMQVVWQDGTHAHCVLYHHSVTCLEAK